MTKHILIAAAILIIPSGAISAAEMSKAGVRAGTYCQVVEPDVPDGASMIFKAGKCKSDSELSGLTVKLNGDFFLAAGVGDDVECKINPKASSRGWTGYNCKTYGARVMKSKKLFKWVTFGDGTISANGL